MDRDIATRILIAEAFNEGGVGLLLADGDDPGENRLARLLAAIGCLSDELVDESQMDRQLVLALVYLVTSANSLLDTLEDDEEIRESLPEQLTEISNGIIELIENFPFDEEIPSLEDLGNFVEESSDNE
jgi:hypothetical protein